MRRTLLYLLLDILWLIGALIIYGVPVFCAGVSGRWVGGRLPEAVGWAAAFLVGYGVFLLALILCTGLMHRLFPRARSGSFPLRSREAVFFYFQHGIKCYVTSTFLIRQINHLSFLRTFYYRLMGCRYHPSAFVGLDSELHDPSLITVEERAFIGEGVHIYAHMVLDDRLHIRPVRIGKKALIGAHTIIGPGAVIEERAQVGARSAVGPGAHIKSGELWIGAPARRVKRLGRKRS